MRNNFFDKSKNILILGIACLLGVGLLLYAYAPWGIGVEYDGFIYLSGANNLLDGNGFSFWNNQGDLAPIIHFPPLYPILIAGISWITKVNADQAAEILNLLTLASLIYLTGYLVIKFSGSIIAGGLAAGFVAISDSVFMINQWALTESLFLVLLLLSFLFLDRYLSTKKMSALILTGIVAGLSYLTRYVGLTVIGLGGLMLLLNRDQVFKEKVKNTFYFALVSGLTIAPALIRNQLSGGKITSRNFTFHPIPWYEIRLALVRLSWWISDDFSQKTGVTVFCIFIIGIIGLWIWLKYSTKNSSEPALFTVKSQKFVSMLGSYIIIYLSFLLLSRTFFDASTPLGNRILSPVYITGVIFVFLVSWFSFSNFKKPWLMIIWLLIWGLFIAVVFSRTWYMVNHMRASGLGFNGQSWKESSTMAWIQEQPEEVKIYSNESFPISFLIGRYIYPVPEGQNPVDNIRVASYYEKIDAMHTILEEQEAYLVIFDTIEAHPEYYTVEELASGLTLLIETEDGIIYYHPDNQVLFEE